jgi:hypothetical protein
LFIFIDSMVQSSWPQVARFDGDLYDVSRQRCWHRTRQTGGWPFVRRCVGHCRCGGRCGGGWAGFRPDLELFAVDPDLDRAALEILDFHCIGLAVDADA